MNLEKMPLELQLTHPNENKEKIVKLLIKNQMLDKQKWKCLTFKYIFTKLNRKP